MKWNRLVLVSLIPACLALEPPQKFVRGLNNQDDMKSRVTSIKSSVQRHLELEVCETCDLIEENGILEQREGIVKTILSRVGSGAKKSLGNLRKATRPEKAMSLEDLKDGLVSAGKELNAALNSTMEQMEEYTPKTDRGDLVITLFDIQENFLRGLEDFLNGGVNVVRNVGLDSLDVFVTAMLGVVDIVEEIILYPVDVLTNIYGEFSPNGAGEALDTVETKADTIIGPVVGLLLLSARILVKVLETTPRDIYYAAACLLQFPECNDAAVDQDQVPVIEANQVAAIDVPTLDEEKLMENGDEENPDVTCQVDLVTCELNNLKILLEDAGYYS